MKARHSRPLGDFLKEPIDDAHVDRLCQLIEKRREGSSERSIPRQFLKPSVLMPVGIACVAVICALVVLFSESSTETLDNRRGPLRLVSGGELKNLSVAQGAQNPEGFDCDDGSTLMLWPGTQLGASINNEKVISLQMEEGQSQIFVNPGGFRTWKVDLGIARITVLGTKFKLLRSHDRAEISVESGRVSVASEHLSSRVTELGPGETVEIATRTSPPDETPDESIVVREQRPAEPLQTPGKAKQNWRTLAKRGQYQNAYKLLGTGGVQRLTQKAQTIEELLSLADVARLSGHPREAVEPLERVIREHRSDRRASVAAFTLGRVESDALGRYSRAARAFSTCIRLGPPEALQPDVFARLAESHIKAGHTTQAREAVDRYLKRFPNGRQAEYLRGWRDTQ